MNEIELDDPESFMSNVILEANSSGVTGKQIVRYSTELKKLQEKEGKSFTQLVEEIKDRKREYEELAKVKGMLEEQIHVVRNELEKSLTEMEVTQKELEEYKVTRNKLTSAGLNVEDLDLLKNIVRNLEGLEYDLNEILDFYSSTKLIQEQLKRRIQENERLSNKNLTLREKNQSLEIELERNLEISSAVKSHLEASIRPRDILTIVRTVTDMGAVLGLEKDKALDRFMTDIKTGYNERNGYTFQIEELKTLNKVYEEKNTTLKEQLDILEEVLDDRRKAVESLRRMEILGIEDREIVKWMELLESHDYDITSFRVELAKLGGLPEFLHDKKTHIANLEAREKELLATVEKLEKKLAALQENLNKIRETIELETDKIKKVMEEFEDYFTSPETGFKARSRRIVDDIVMNLTEILMETKQEWNVDLEELDNIVKKVVQETDRILTNAYTGGRIIGRFHSLEPIYKLLREEPLPKTEATIGVITMMAYIKLWLGKNYPEELVENCDEIIERLTRDLGVIY
jgi:hypothetical protein